jgi:Ca-activated chloride channel family protein
MHFFSSNDSAKSLLSPFRRVAGRQLPPRRFLHTLFAVLAACLAGLVLGAWHPTHVASAQTVSPERSFPAAALEAKSENGGSALLPLISESLSVRIDDGHATATYSHIFQNETASRLEGNYRLLVGEGATATGFSYYNGDQKIVGEIFERQAAQEVYEALTGLRRDPGLLEAAGEGGFFFHVFPIEPGEQKQVHVTTSRFLQRREGRVEYRARLSRADAKVAITLKDARGIKSLECASHELRTERAPDGTWTATVVREKNTPSGDRSFHELVVRYEPDEGPLVLRSTVHHDAGQAAFFTATLATPPSPAEKVRQGNDVTLVLDRSGSMEGESIESARAAAKAIVERLLPTDRINVIAFDDEVDALYSAPRALGETVRRDVLSFIRHIEAGGGTDIARALAKALTSQVGDGRPNVVLFLTDGQSAGPPAIEVASKDRSDARVFTVGLGAGVDKALLSRIASIKHGRFTFIADPRAVAAEFPKVLAQLEEPVLTDVTLQAEGGSLTRVYPNKLSDLFPGDELRVFGRATTERSFKLVLEGRDHGVVRRFETQLDTSSSAEAPWVARGWAQSRVDELLEQTSANGDSDERQNEVIELGLAYELITPYTSFLAIPESAMTEDAQVVRESMRERRKHILAMRTDAAALSRLNMPPGDPVLRVHAPRDAARVTAMFPFGQAQDLAYDDESESWMTRFLVPNDVADGSYEVRVIIVLADGTVQATLAHYTIDSKEAQVEVDASPSEDGIDVRATADEALIEVRIAASDDLRHAVALTPSADKRAFTGHIRLAPGRHRLRIVASDLARNETEREIDVEVPSPASRRIR